MALLKPEERAFARAISCISYCNPFLPERIEHEKKALGDEFEKLRDPDATDQLPVVIGQAPLLFEKSGDLQEIGLEVARSHIR